MVDDKTIYRGSCFCGAVEVAVSGEPFAMGYCHCKDCRAWSAGPVNAFALWGPDAVEVTKGEEFLAGYNKTEDSHRRFCSRCGGHVMTRHVPGEFVDVYAAVLPDLTFKPQVHVNYASAVLRIPDGLPKLKDFPTEMGGSGETMRE
ncbi:GFA family protein [Aquibaculum arenosum]|uniref:GFA family protein n=1 Tax=Aquibaculum arenosum TaxID=3032591 RepID=A0ABT5YK09_9PROT|nr:GFA family protein [Fodinicurvata sp. CAU 1616]MDF2094599.1 GFA family protein [Fodinicurvata sp. CAU 1616]